MSKWPPKDGTVKMQQVTQQRSGAIQTAGRSHQARLRDGFNWTTFGATGTKGGLAVSGTTRTGPSGEAQMMLRHAIQLAAMAILIVPSLPGSLRAQPTAEDIALGRFAFQQTADCRFCHGWAADGEGDPVSPGNAANLRVTKLDRERFVEAISCGRPATAMPRFDRLAYSDRRCYGLTDAELGNDLPPPPPAGFISRALIDAIADYLIAEVAGQGPPTHAQCVAALGADPGCDGYAK